METSASSWVTGAKFRRGSGACDSVSIASSLLDCCLPPNPALCEELQQQQKQKQRASCHELEADSDFTFPSPLSSVAFTSTSACSSPSSCSYSAPATSPRRLSTDAKSSSLFLSAVARTPSWSDYFRRPGGERAVLPALSWMVDLSQLYLGQRVAAGKSCRLYQGLYQDRAVAVKLIRQPDDDHIAAYRLERAFTQEVTILSQIRHRNVVQFIAACKKPPTLCVITEFLREGSLRSFLCKRNGQPLPQILLASMALDIACGMEYLHSNGVIHRDLKSDNLLLTDDLQVKVADFGAACHESQCNSREGDVGTYRWMAPEMINRKQCGRKADVYSFGIILWELVTTRIPFDEMTPVQAAFAVVHKNARPTIPSNCPGVLKALMNLCWSANPDHRPEIWEIWSVLQEFQDSLHGNHHGGNSSSSNNVWPSFEFSPDRTGFLPTWLQ